MIVDFDVLVLGSGIAGLSFALRVSEFCKVGIITKKSDSTSNTNNAQGGIAAVIANTDTYDSHVADTLTAGAGLCNVDSVNVLVREGPDRIRELVEMGVQFTKNFSDDSNDMHLDLGREGGHSARRIVHAQDLTGKEVERVLVRMVKINQNIHMFEHHQALELITKDVNGKKTIAGALVLDTETGDEDTFRAKIIMLSTGGLCQVYKHTTNPEIATGDGIAMAFNAGAEISNLEFIQFHPTSLYHPEADSFLISEAVRGEGGILRLPDGTRFMPDYHPLKELAPRDIVARAIDNELKKNDLECVYLDVTHLDEDFITHHFPYIYKNCLKYGIDITKQQIPTVPAAHYSCGGVKVNLNAQTTIDNLYACGEVSCTGVHGANRLASNSLLEAVVYSRRASNHVENIIKSLDFLDVPDNKEVEQTDISSNIIEVENTIAKVKDIMWRYVGIVRTNERLEKALTQLNEVNKTIESLFERSRVTSRLIELRNITTCAKLITISSLKRKESRGLNYNLDYPNRDDQDCLHDTIITKDNIKL